MVDLVLILSLNVACLTALVFQYMRALDGPLNLALSIVGQVEKREIPNLKMQEISREQGGRKKEDTIDEGRKGGKLGLKAKRGGS
jgi:hypothetical protein